MAGRVPTGAALSKARARVGEDPLRRLFGVCAAAAPAPASVIHGGSAVGD
jgi:hypothetical protein